MTTKEFIIGYLKDKGWVNKGLIMQDIVEIAKENYGYADTVSRELRRLREDGKLADRKKGKGTEYCYITPHSNWWQNKSVYATAKEIAESKEVNLKLI